MKAKTRTALQEWLDALSARGVDAAGPDGFTSQELAGALGVGRAAAATRIQKEIHAGRLVFAGHRQSRSITGTTCRIPVYRLP